MSIMSIFAEFEKKIKISIFIITIVWAGLLPSYEELTYVMRFN